MTQAKPTTLPISLITLDTCVLMHSFTRRLLLRLCASNNCSPAWSDNIGEEWLRNAPRIWRVAHDVVLTEWLSMQAQFPQSNMGCIEEIPALFGRIDKKDRHVAWCAVKAQQHFNVTASILLTWNTKDFHKRELREQGISLFTPDQYLVQYWQQSPDTLLPQLEQGLVEHISLGLPEYSLVELLKRDKLYRLAKLVSSLNA
ncbi:PIN domain-containing protein [Pelistega sp. MC2]|uniref:PIN domain-containing protein n=1 Tax=Pelistega sp. MC2 TaxID=1720297 RepID=UPI0008D8E806|nr:PIN domain-containing protein [Pelistega sp. MC2]